MPPLQAARRPGLSRTAPVKAPLTCPKSSLSRSSGDRDGQDTTPKGRAARGPQVWMVRARSVLPVPDSPLISRVASLPATRRAISRVLCMAGLRLVKSASGDDFSRASCRASTFFSRLRTSATLRIRRFTWPLVKGLGR